MPYIFKPKHQKLILECYPPKRLSVNSDSKPNKSKLSYLIYYASTRRTKLEKVGDFLIKKTRSDVARGRIGNMKVTLYIVQELVDKCSDDLGILAGNIIHILQMIQSVRDLGTCQLASTVFLSFCKKLQPLQRQVFSSNSGLLTNFLLLTSAFLQYGDQTQQQRSLSSAGRSHRLRTYSSTAQITQPATRHNDWLRISLNTTQSVADYVDPEYSGFNKVSLIDKSIYLLLDVIKKHTSSIGELFASGRGSTVSAVRSSDDDSSVSDSGEAIGSLALGSLKSFFDTNNKRQVDMSTGAIISYALEGTDLHWINKIVSLCAKKTHIELRYRIVSTMMVKLNSFEEPKVKVFLCAMISNLLSSEDVNLVGLPVKDILTNVLVNQRSLVTNDASKASINELTAAYLDMITSLGKHVYYNTQINDIVTGILAFYHEYATAANEGEAMTELQFITFSRIVLRDVQEVCEVCQDDSYLKYKRADYPLNLFNYLYYTLVYKREDGTDTVDQENRSVLRVAWLKVLGQFYVGPDINKHRMQMPNVEMVITSNMENPLCLFFDLVSKIVDDSPSDELLAEIWEISKKMIDLLQVNYLANLLKYAGAWLRREPGSFLFNYCLLALSRSSVLLKLTDVAQYADWKLNVLEATHQLPPYFSYGNRLTDSVSDKPDVDYSSIVEMLRKHDVISQWLSYTGDRGDEGDFTVPVVAASPPTQMSIGKALASAAMRFSTSTGNAQNAPNSPIAVPRPQFRARAESAGAMSFDRSLARSINSVRTVTTVRDLASIVSGFAPAGAGNGNNNNTLLLDAPESVLFDAQTMSTMPNLDGYEADDSANPISITNGAVTHLGADGNVLSIRSQRSPRSQRSRLGLAMSPPVSPTSTSHPKKRSGLAFCIANLELSDSESESELADGTLGPPAMGQVPIITANGS